MKKNKQYTLGMIVRNKLGIIGIVSAVSLGDDDLNGKEASVVWLNGDADAWWEWGELEIVENPLEKYRKAYKQKKIVMTSETGKTRSCKYDEDVFIETLSDFLEQLGDYPEDLERVDDFVIDAMEEGYRDFEYTYYYNEDDDYNSENEHTLKIKVVG